MSTKKRKYHSERRARSKEETVTAILDSAVKLHEQGITSIQALANDAGVSVASVRKYFPTQEKLFRGCSAHFYTKQTPPSIELWEGVADRDDRIRICVERIYPFLEAAMGVIGLAYRLQDESEAMKENVMAIERYLDAAVDTVLGGAGQDAETRKAVRFILHPLSYRNMRIHGGLQFDECVKFSSNMLAMLIK
ncbi:TetR/AcrR family transcriptional regulator [Paenibacillus sp.]|uniref:TetR/AcrR family transcriptional regulator n=1 Tax=Paenibacillus sp. TaxID=58172 RepID=UPI002D5DC524|nr:TetR/AcrR family transcriptional regulator [Paenibacillus sp.]HZG84834.1 TetR/AcrR family transcriptional regulator [Paenibacillus sp.]